MKKTLNQLRDEIHANAVKHGFYEFENSVPNGALVDEVEHAFFAQKIALIHSELSEALEADRANSRARIKAYKEALAENHRKYGEDCIGNDMCSFSALVKNTVEDELADVIIRVLDLCGHLKIDIEKHVELKMRYNELRKYKHDKSY